MSYSNQPAEIFKSILKKNKYYVTQPRLMLFQILSYSSAPLSIAEIRGESQDQISRASVYRTLESLIKLDIVRRVSIAREDKYELGDKFSRHHHHLTCEQ